MVSRLVEQTWGRRRFRTSIAVVLFVGGALIVASHLSKLAGKQQPNLFYDSHVFLEIAAQPPSVAHVFYPKPFVTPAFDRLAGTPDSIVSAQVVLSFVAWLVLAGVLCLVLRRIRSRVIGALACGAFVLAPVRVGFTAAILSESLDDSLRVIAIALTIALVATAQRITTRRTLVCSLIAIPQCFVVIALIFTRDTEAIVVLIAATVAGSIRLQPRGWWWRRERWAAVVAVVVMVVAIFAIVSSQVIPKQPVGLTWMENWAPESTARGAYPLVDNVMMRVMTDPDAKARAIDAGLPWSAELDRFIGHAPYPEFMSSAVYQPQRDWIFAHGTRNYVGWLIRHGIRRAEELVVNLWYVLTPPDFGRTYMPTNWRANTYGRSVMQLFRGTTESAFFVLTLMIVSPLLWRRVRRHPLAAVAAVLVWSAIIGIVAAYYGDAMEVARHAWGAGQQLILALVMIGLLRLDEMPAAA